MNSDDGGRSNIYTEKNNDTEPENNVNFPEDSTRQENKRSKRQHVNKDTWNVKNQKINSEKGVGYQGKTKIDGKYRYNTNKSERKVKSRCKYSLNNVGNWCKSKNETPLSIGAFSLAFENEISTLTLRKKTVTPKICQKILVYIS
ncbi:hypothetical protein CBL_10532 [Carabus blaptoides fortunei]